MKEEVSSRRGNLVTKKKKNKEKVGGEFGNVIMNIIIHNHMISKEISYVRNSNGSQMAKCNTFNVHNGVYFKFVINILFVLY